MKNNTVSMAIHEFRYLNTISMPHEKLRNIYKIKIKLFVPFNEANYS